MLYLQGFGFDFDPILSFLGDAVSAIFAAIGAFFAYLYSLLVFLVQFLWNVLVVVAQFLVRILGHIRNFFVALWENVIKRGVVKLLAIFAKIRAKLQQIFGPILRIIRRIRQWIDRHILPIVLRVINAIQRIRQILVVFRILGFEWAKALDRKLAQLENDIQGAFEFVRRRLNLVATIIELILQPNLLMRRNVLLGSLLSSLGAVKRALGLGTKRPLTDEEQKIQDRDRNRYKSATVLQHAAVLAESGPTKEDEDMRQAARSALENVIGEPLPF